MVGETGTGAVDTATARRPVPGDGRPPRGTLPPVIDEPPEPRRIRRPADLLRVVFGLGAMLLILGLGLIAGNTTKGAETDLASGRLGQAIPLGFILAATSVILAVVPIALAIERLYRRETRRVIDSVLAAALAYVIAFGLNLWVGAESTPGSVKQALTLPAGAAGNTNAFHIYLVTLVAYMTIVGFGNRHNLQSAVWGALIADGVVTLINGDTTLIGLILSILLGRTIAFAWRYACGVTNARPTGESVVASLADAGLDPVSCRRVPDGDDMRRYEAVTTIQGTLDIIVMDRDQQAAGLLYRLYRRLRLRRPAQRRNLLSLRRMLEQEALMSYAVSAAGIRTPKLIAVRDLGPDTGMLAYQQVHGRVLDQLKPAELTDELLAELWDLLADLHSHQLAHRRLSPNTFLVDDDNRLWLTELRLGEVAAGTFQQRLDIAEMLTVLGMVFGPERAVKAATDRFGEQEVAASLPMLQPVVLTRSTRAALKKSKDTLSMIRDEVLALHPEAEVEPVKLERLKPRTLFSVVGLAVAAYFLAGQLTQWKSLGSVSIVWAAAVLGCSALTYVAAAMALDGFVPEKLSWPRTLLSQIAASFATLVAPAAVGGVAVNTRYLQRSGIPTGAAVAAVGAQQIIGLIQHILLIMVFGVIASDEGASAGGSTPTSATLIAIILIIALLILLIAAIPVLRRFALTRLKPFFSGIVPRLLDVAQNPVKLATGLCGTVLLSLLNITALWASVKAFDHNHVSYAAVGVVFLTAQAAGSVIPTPGGVGGVEAALITALKIIAGVDPSIGTTAVLLFRAMTFWLPVLPGWLAFTWMQKRGEL